MLDSDKIRNTKHLYFKLFSDISRASYFHSQKQKFSEEIVSHLEQIRKEKERTTIDKKIDNLIKTKKIKKKIYSQFEKDKLEELAEIENKLKFLEDAHSRLINQEKDKDLLKKLELKIKKLKKEIKKLKEN